MRSVRKLARDPNAGGDPAELGDVAAARPGVLVPPLEVGLVPEAGGVDLGRPSGVAPPQEREERRELRPCRPAARRDVRRRRGRGPVGLDFGQDGLRRDRPDPRQELQDPEARQPVARVLGEAQQREQVLDVCGLEELQAAELHERDVAPGELELERTAVVGGAKEDRLRLQGGPRLARRQHLGAHVVGLRRLVDDGDEHRR